MLIIFFHSGQGAVLFASAISCLSWENILSSHWSARALFYSSIIFAFVAVVTGQQQQMVLPREEPGKDFEPSDTDLDKFTETIRNGGSEVVFALQTPLMLFSLAAASFLAGLFSVVFSPLGSNLEWGNDAKVCCVSGSIEVHQLMSVPDCGSLWACEHSCDYRLHCKH